MFQGAITALITPFDNDNQIDEHALVSIIKWQADNGIKTIVVSGTTGEAATLSSDEHYRIIKIAVECGKSFNLSIIAGASSNSTDQAVKLAKQAERAGADAIMSICPYYNKPTQEGLYQHFKAIHDEIDIPLLPYNHPGRTGVNLSDDTIIRFTNLSNIIGMKESGDNSDRIGWIKKNIAREFYIFCDDDLSAITAHASGADGIISVLSNILPDMVTKMQDFMLNNDYQEAREINNKVYELASLMFCETNPAPIKYAMHLLGLSSPYLRLPLVSISKNNQEKIKQALGQFYEL